MGIVEVLVTFIAFYPKSIAFLSGFISEELILFLAILAAEEKKLFWTITFFSFMGVVFHDALICLLGRTKVFGRFAKRMELKENNKGLVQFLEKMGGGHYLLPLALSKFIYGTRIALIFYVSNKYHKFSKFFFVNTIALLVWFIVMMPLAWLAGRGFSELIHYARGLEKLLAIAFFSVVFLYLARKLIIKILFKNKEIKKD